MKSSTWHYAFAVAWMLLVVPTLTVWSDSITWVGFISVYANVVSHWGAAEAARAKEAAEA